MIKQSVWVAFIFIKMSTVDIFSIKRGGLMRIEEMMDLFAIEPNEEELELGDEQDE